MPAERGPVARSDVKSPASAGVSPQAADRHRNAGCLRHSVYSRVPVVGYAQRRHDRREKRHSVAIRSTARQRRVEIASEAWGRWS